MSYVAFALKYRPSRFDEVIGQKHVVIALRNAISKGRVHHAYLFSGPRGIGKTSVARIFAKSLNCEHGPTINPCGTCTSCIEISRGASLDIVEIDGASNRGIDEIRILRENTKLSPAHARFKIYIIDEVHMLTQEAFNALLKTLEEPPPHVKFIFATTHPQKVLPTILSRCQKFQFNLLALEDIIRKLKKIVELENIKVDNSLLYAVGRAASGSIRDAESLLDQLACIAADRGRVADILSFLGIIDEDTLNTAAAHIVNKDLLNILAFIDKVEREGKDLGIFLGALIEHLRNLLLAKVSIRNFRDLTDISPQSKDFIRSLADKLLTKEVLNVIDLLLEAKTLSQRLNSVRIPLELALIKFAYEEGKETPVKKNNSASAGPVIKPGDSASQSSPAPKKDTAIAPPHKGKLDDDFTLDEVDFSELDGDTSKSQPSSESGTSDTDSADSPQDDISPINDNVVITELKTKWQHIISNLQKIRAALASHLSFAHPISSAGSVVECGFLKKDKFHKEVAAAPKNLKFVEAFVSKLMGRKVNLNYIFIDSVPGQAQELKDIPQDNDEPVSSSPEAADSKDGDNEFINELLDTFGGKLHTDDS